MKLALVQQARGSAGQEVKRFPERRHWHVWAGGIGIGGKPGGGGKLLPSFFFLQPHAHLRIGGK